VPLGGIWEKLTYNIPA